MHNGGKADKAELKGFISDGSFSDAARAAERAYGRKQTFIAGAVGLFHRGFILNSVFLKTCQWRLHVQEKVSKRSRVAIGLIFLVAYLFDDSRPRMTDLITIPMFIYVLVYYNNLFFRINEFFSKK